MHSRIFKKGISLKVKNTSKGRTPGEENAKYSSLKRKIQMKRHWHISLHRLKTNAHGTTKKEVKKKFAGGMRKALACKPEAVLIKHKKPPLCPPP